MPSCFSDTIHKPELRDHISLCVAEKFKQGQCKSSMGVKPGIPTLQVSHETDSGRLRLLEVPL